MRRDHLVRHGHELLRLGHGLVALEHVHVHLVTVIVCVKGLGAGNGQAKAETRHGIDAKSLDGSAVQRGLAVKEHPVASAQVPLHHPANLQRGSQRLAGGQVHHAQEHSAVVASVARKARLDNVYGARVTLSALHDARSQLLDVEGRDALRKGQHLHAAARHAQLPDVVAGVGADNGACTKVGALSGQRATQTPRLAVQAHIQVTGLAAVAAG